jgi:DNA-directed RNA polymerase I, II, and III subunit RPABC1
MLLDNIFQVCIEMFEAREYKNITKYDDYIEALNNNNKLVRCYIISQNKLNKNLLKYYYGIFITNKIKHGILVYYDSITCSVTRLLENMNSLSIECFKFEELMFNITKHQLVPQHIKVNLDDHPQKNMYPIMKKSDPISKFYGYSSGDVIKIIRKNGTISFRIVK